MSGARRDARPRAVTERIPVSAPPRAPHTAHGAHVLRISAPWRDCMCIAVTGVGAPGPRAPPARAAAGRQARVAQHMSRLSCCNL